jgi:hypothetical protein
MSAMSVVLVVSGIVCLGVSGTLLYFMLPRADRAPEAGEHAFGETGWALGQFVLMVAGIALLIKGLA